MNLWPSNHFLRPDFAKMYVYPSQGTLLAYACLHYQVDINRTEKSPPASDPSHLVSKEPSVGVDQPPSSQQKSTFKDVLAVLQLLEEEPSPLQPLDPAYVPMGTLEDLGFAGPPLSMDQGKLQNILSYLDEMERKDEHLKDQLTTSHLEAKTHSMAPDTAATQRLAFIIFVGLPYII